MTSAPNNTSASLLVFSVSGRIGSGASFVAEKLRDELYRYKYEVEIVDVTVLLLLARADEVLSDDEDVGEQAMASLLKAHPSPHARTAELQNIGNQLRAQYGNNVLARLVVRDFIRKQVGGEDGVRKRQAFIIDSLKRPEEVSFLREVLGDCYSAIGVVSSDVVRSDRLRERKGYDDEQFSKLSDRDRKEGSDNSGQRAVETVLRSDYFFANDYPTKDEIGKEVERFVGLIFRSTMITPRHDEFAMNVAFKAAAKSACLSRQVGAAVFDTSGQLLATGCNDVPKYGGGLYDAEPDDRRCWARGGKCYNDEEKRLITEELVESILDAAKTSGELPLDREEMREQLTSIIRNSRIRQLIEFSRAVHAEMDAILTIARTGTAGIVGGTLYCTTYPCHNCAKHIIDAGLAKVVYLEPYEKSLARKLHSDAIDDRSSSDRGDLLRFAAYNGVSPARYAEFFEVKQSAPRKNREGIYMDRSANRADLLPTTAARAEEVWRRIDSAASASDLREGNDEPGHEQVAEPSS